MQLATLRQLSTFILMHLVQTVATDEVQTWTDEDGCKHVMEQTSLETTYRTVLCESDGVVIR